MIYSRAIFAVIGAGFGFAMAARAQDGAPAAPVPPVVAELRREVLKKNTDPGGFPLPVVGHWANGFDRPNFSSDYQVELLARGHHVLPTLPMPNEGDADYPEKGRPVVETLARWNAPFSLRAGQWEMVMLSKKHPLNEPGKWRNAPPDKSPLALDPATGQPNTWISPFGAIEPWHEAGTYYTSSGAFGRLQKLYPNPPRVIFLSNNEARRLEAKHDWAALEKRYAEKVGPGKTRTQRNAVVVAGYVERYAALLEGMREGLSTPPWRDAAFFVAYGAFGPPHLARWPGWVEYSEDTDDRIDPWHLVWQGGSPSYYTHNWNQSTDYKVWSPQVEANNWVFMLQDAHRDRPEFWFELSIWDGNFSANRKPDEKARARSKKETYLAAGQAWAPQRYAGFVQYGMWLLRPRVVREFRGSTVPRAEYGQDFEALVAAVDRVWTNPTLAEFWRNSELVPNRARKHPYQSDLPAKWAGRDRWFLLNTSLDPAGEWKPETEIPVFSLARVRGERGRRQWLVYAHSPLKDRRGVDVEIPGYRRIPIDVSVGGTFHVISEANGEVRELK